MCLYTYTPFKSSHSDAAQYRGELVRVAHLHRYSSRLKPERAPLPARGREVPVTAFSLTADTHGAASGAWLHKRCCTAHLLIRWCCTTHLLPRHGFWPAYPRCLATPGR